MRRHLTGFILATALISLPAAATELEVRLPPDSTVIDFELKATMHTVHGSARLERGDFTIDTDSGVATGEAVVAAASAETGNNKRDKKMHAKVLLSDRHGRIAIRAERIEGRLALQGTSEIVLVGVMELIGADHPIRVPMTVTVEGDVATVDASFSVPYVEWGLEDPSTFVLRVGKEVPVTIRAEGVSVLAVSSP